MSTKSPTLADLELQGFVGFYVTCANPMCRYSTPIRFESLRLNPSTPFPRSEKCVAWSVRHAVLWRFRSCRNSANIKRLEEGLISLGLSF